jgi:hypothetical protein
MFCQDSCGKKDASCGSRGLLDDPAWVGATAQITMVTVACNLMKHRAWIGGLASLGVAALALAACGNPVTRLSAQQAVGDAVNNALAGPGVNIRVSLGVNPQQLMQINRVEHGGSDLTPQAASAISKTSIAVNVYPGHGESIGSQQFATDTSNQLGLAVDVGNSTPVQVRYLGGVLYAQANLGTLVSEFGPSSASAGKIQGELQNADKYVHGLGALADGGWVSANLDALSPFLKSGRSNASGTDNYGADVASVLNQLKAALTTNATYSDLGTHGGRTEYQITVHARSFLQHLATSLQGDIAKLGGSMPLPGASNATDQITKPLSQAANQVPANQKVVAHLWVKGNTAQELDLDINQFDHKFSFAVPLRFVLASPAPVAMPTGVTPIDFSNVSKLLGGLMGAGQSSTR